MNNRMILLVLCFCMIGTVSMNAQTTVMFPAAKDASIFSDVTSGSNGAGNLFVGRTNQPANRRALIQFDLSSIPAEAVIADAVLMIRGSRQSTNSVDLHRLTSDWGEGTTTGSGNGGGQASTGQDGDATWSHAFFDASPWGTAGGDFIANPSANAPVNNGTTNMWGGPGLIADVQDWVSGSHNNFGWILIGEENQTNTAVRMVSREANNNTPMLEVTYIVDEVCNVDGGTISSAAGEANINVCIIDQIAAPFTLNVTGNSGPMGQWVVSQISNGTISSIQDASTFDLTGILNGPSRVEFISFQEGLTGLAVGEDRFALEGCFESSNALILFPDEVDGGELELISGDNAVEVCVGDGVADEVTVFDFNALGAREFIITNDQGEILATANDNTFDFENAGEGVCMIYRVSSSIFFEGFSVGQNINEVVGCYDLSNPITVNRVTSGEFCAEECTAVGGVLNDGNYEFCVGDGIADNIPEGEIQISGQIGTNSQWVVTNDLGTEILGLSENPSDVDFDGAGEGTCLVWHLSYEDGLTGLMIGGLIEDLNGCFSLSENSVSISRVSSGEVCEPPVEPIALQAILTATQQNAAVLSPAKGTIEGVLEGNTLRIGGSFEDLRGQFAIDIAGGAHIHNGIAGRNGDIVVSLNTATTEDLRSGSYDQELNTFELTDEQVADLLARNYYINIHTDMYPAGEIRGQIVPAAGQVFHTQLFGSNEVPSVISTGMGSVIGEFSGDQLVISGSVNDLSSEIATEIAGGAHIHSAPVGRNGALEIPLVFTLDESMRGGVFEAANNTFTLSAGQVDALTKEGLYINVHTADYNSGEVRGQIAPVACATFRGELTGYQQVPSIMSGGDGRVLLNYYGNGNITVSGSVNNLESDLNVDIAGGAHIHNAYAGRSGGVEAVLVFDTDTTDRSGVFQPDDNTFELTQAQVDQLFDRAMYVNVHSIDQPGGELRGQLMNSTKSYFGANLLGINEVQPVSSPGSGHVQIEMNGENIVVTGGFSGMTGDFASDIVGGSHIHTGDAIGNGGIAYTLGATLDADLKGGIYTPGMNTFDITPGTSDSLARALLYVNIHSTEFASGELRGQIQTDNNFFPDPNFQIINPEEGLAFDIDISAEEMLTIDWEATTDVDDELLVYIWQLADDAEFGNVLISNQVGTNLNLILPPTEIDDLLEGAGIEPGTSGIFHHRVLASDGSVNKASDSRSIVFNRIVQCEVNGGALTGGPFEFCVGDGIADNIPADAITLTGNTGTNSAWVVTDEAGNILGLPPTFSDVDFDGAGPGTCLVWHLSFEDGLTGAEVGMNANDLVGCFDLSNPITVVRNEVNGGELTGGPFEFCVGDGVADNIPADAITLTGNTGPNNAWVVTDEAGNILGLPPTFSDVDFDGAGPGTCLVWHLSFEDGLTGAEVGRNANDLEGCFDLSNPISVIRNQPDGGELSGGPFEFCVGDGIADNIPADAITLSGNTGPNNAWVVTDEEGNILGLPPTFSDVDFDGAGPGTCLVWHLSFEDGLTGAEVGRNANDLHGCFDLSNPISVVRTEDGAACISCDVDGGELSGGPFDFCVGDGIADQVPQGSVTVSGNMGTNAQWVVTDQQGRTILGLPDDPADVNFDGAGPGICLIWHLTYEDGLTGLVLDGPISDLEGCFALSANSVSIVRLEPQGGTLTGGPFEFCVGDGIADQLSATDILLSGSSGSNTQWVITDESGIILGLPGSYTDVNFDGAGPGVCQIYHVSYEEGLSGLEMGANINDLDGCHGITNSVSVNRVSGSDCDGECTVDGGTVATANGLTEYTICAGDGLADPFDVIITNSSGMNQLVITDEDGTILAVPDGYRIDLEGAGTGICKVWNIAYDSESTVIEPGIHIDDLQGCSSISNAITVTRISCDATCQTPLNFRAQELTGNRFKLRWNQVAKARGYEVAIGLKDNPSSFVTLAVKRNSITLRSTINATIVVKVRTRCSFGEFSEYTGYLELNPGNDKSAEARNGNSGRQVGDFIIYDTEYDISPNPASNFLQLQYDQGEIQSQIRIIDFMGRILKTEKTLAGSNRLNIDISDLPEGIYLLTISNDDQQFEEHSFIIAR